MATNQLIGTLRWAQAPFQSCARTFWLGACCPPVDTFLDEHLGELHYGGKTTMSGVPLTCWRALPVVFDHETTDGCTCV